MRYLITIAALFIASIAAAQSGTTVVTAQVQDNNGTLYANCQWSVVFVGQNTTPGAGPYAPASLLNGQQGNCDSQGNFAVNLADNLNTVTPTPSQWAFSICSAPGYVPGGTYCKANILATITGTAQSLTTFFAPLLPLLPTSGGTSILPTNNTFTGNNIFSGQLWCHSSGNVRCVDPANKAGWSGASVDTWIAAATTDLGASGGTVQLATGNYTIAAAIAAASNVAIACDPSHGSILSVGASYSGSLYSATSVTNFRLTGCVLDGNRAANSNSNGLVTITNSSYGTIQNNHLRNTLGNGIYLPNGDLQIDILNNQVYRVGPLLPSQTVAINIGSSGGNPVSHVRILDNTVHDCSLGIYIQPNLGTSNVEEDFDISRNRVYSCANDGIAVFSANHNAGPVRGVRTIDNEVYCNGWPANGTNFNTNCTPGLLQTGATASNSGVGIDYNSSLQEQGVIANNRSHDNYFEGIDVEDAIVSTVSTVGTAMSWVSNDLFLTSWKPNQSIRLGANTFHISSCSSTVACTLTTSPGTNTFPLAASGMNSRTIVSGNILYNNGVGNNNTSGHGGADIFGYMDTWSNNLAYLNNALGFIDTDSVLSTHTGDIAISNDQSTGGFHDGFLCEGCLYAKWSNIQADDPTAVPQQGNVAHFDGDTNNSVATLISTPNSTFTAYIDAGTNDVIEVNTGLGMQLTAGLATPTLGPISANSAPWCIVDGINILTTLGCINRLNTQGFSSSGTILSLIPEDFTSNVFALNNWRGKWIGGHATTVGGISFCASSAPFNCYNFEVPMVLPTHMIMEGINNPSRSQGGFNSGTVFNFGSSFPAALGKPATPTLTCVGSGGAINNIFVQLSYVNNLLGLANNANSNATPGYSAASTETSATCTGATSVTFTAPASAGTGQFIAQDLAVYSGTTTGSEQENTFTTNIAASGACTTRGVVDTNACKLASGTITITAIPGGQTALPPPLLDLSNPLFNLGTGIPGIVANAFAVRVQHATISGCPPGITGCNANTPVSNEPAVAVRDSSAQEQSGLEDVTFTGPNSQGYFYSGERSGNCSIRGIHMPSNDGPNTGTFNPIIISGRGSENGGCRMILDSTIAARCSGCSSSPTVPEMIELIGTTTGVNIQSVHIENDAGGDGIFVTTAASLVADNVTGFADTGKCLVHISATADKVSAFVSKDGKTNAAVCDDATGYTNTPSINQGAFYNNTEAIGSLVVAKSLTIGSSPTITSGAGAASGNCAVGSVYLNTSAASTSTVVYVCQPVNTWTAITVP